ncbi:Hsp20/alpha crystallin family protein [Phenylobacterium sp.]|jgi:HSP20 family molecular chaperone IbpA|uniref:Hsp20/alpha crystallin family protein n=1 Tax=Phenylobacterium sp. TaxID=1871053 RepID=UPI002726E183|nr:Hsp20/alpha crystallin family protein [Phenylobacterium sp.]MDO9432170.1 Hsp20/alpha crystallin family protein [Phenylobacterium sp.]MDP1601139.1 Hsp20/alpha crystallin family protein [Phenylobacterium sp.]MDP3594145.1 Hsp20/alpha crystallin family protein [Phenylobacterium sp.]
MIGDVSLKLGRRTFSARLEYDSLIGRGLRSVGRRLEAKRGFQSAETTTSKAPTFTVAETIEDVTVAVDVPGHALQDLRLDVTPRHLRLRAAGRQARSGGMVSPIDSSFDLPEPVDPDKVTATLEDGILTVSLVKAAWVRGDAKRVPVREVSVTPKQAGHEGCQPNA